MLQIGIDIGGSKIAVAGCDRGDKLFSARFPLAAGEDGISACVLRQLHRRAILPLPDID
jgi:predicted NBD/HSP70 family sugar kinase